MFNVGDIVQLKTQAELKAEHIRCDEGSASHKYGRSICKIIEIKGNGPSYKLSPIERVDNYPTRVNYDISYWNWSDMNLKPYNTIKINETEMLTILSEA